MHQQFKVACNINLPVDLKKWVMGRAKENSRSFTGEATFLLLKLKQQMESRKTNNSGKSPYKDKSTDLKPVAKSKAKKTTTKKAVKVVQPKKPKQKEEGLFDGFWNDD